MKTKDISSIFGVAPATFFDWQNTSHKKNRLAKLLKNIDLEDALKLLQKEKPFNPKPMMLLSTVNCSIGNKKKHFTLTGLKKLFYKKDTFNIYDKYAIKTIKNEATQIEIDDFASYYKIPSNRIAMVLSA